MIDETPGAGPDETTTPAPAPETPGAPAAGAPSSPEPPSADVGTTEPPASPEAPAPTEPAADESEAEAEAEAPEPQPLVHGADQVAEQVAHDQAQGFHGQEVDQTPNEDYTLPGVQAGEPTPENPEGSDAQ